MAPCVWGQAGGEAAESGGAAGQDAVSREDGREGERCTEGTGGTGSLSSSQLWISRKTHADPQRRRGARCPVGLAS